ncbi:hypothetical protein C8Q74DRAFT_1241735 [Fomes fomentarius]|nr:hypothetical protein C8Q74DRAFT_1241735 [Fomes fomentarius]
MVAQLAIKSLLAKSRQDQVLNTEEAEEDEPTFLEKLEAFTQWLQSMADPPHETYSFSSMTDDHLTKLRISLDGFLETWHLIWPRTTLSERMGSAGFNYHHIIARYKLATRLSL